MSATKRGIACWLLAVAAVIGMEQWTNGQVREAPRPDTRGVVKSVDAGAGTITISGGYSRDREPLPDKTYSLVKNVEVAIGPGAGIGGGRGGVGLFFKEGKLADLTAGINVTLALSADQNTVESILAEGPMVRGQLKAVDPTKNTLTILLPPQGGRERGAAAPEAEEKTYTLTPDAEIAVDDGRGRRFSVKEAKLTDLAQGAQVTVQLSIDRKEAQAVLAEGPSLSGIVKAVDPAKKTLTLATRSPGREAAGEEQTLTVSSTALVVIDDGKGRRLSLKAGKLEDVPAGAAVVVKLSDQASVGLIRVEGPTLTGLLKAVDPDKGIIVIAIPTGRRGDNPEEKTLTVAKDARIAIDGNMAKLADLKATDNGPMLQLRLTLDQKTVQAVMAFQSRPR